MNKQQIIEYINHPELLHEDNFVDLKLLSEKYPYSGVLQTLYTKALHNSESIYFEEQLKKAAINNMNRKKLYQIIHQPKLQRVIEKIEEEIQIEEQNDISTEEKPALNTKLKTEATPTEIKIDKADGLDELERNILTEAINSSMHLDVSDEIPPIEELTKPENKAKETETKSISEEIERSEFTDWFSSGSQPIERRKDVSSLVEGFLNKGADNSVKKEFFSPTNLAKISLVDNEDFVTETLAKVYASQGNFEKAIRIYERLMVNYPEKKTFFASRIRFLKEKKENNKE